MKIASALLAITVAFVFYFHSQRAISYPPGVLIETEPEQVEISDGQKLIEHNEYYLKPLASFSLDGRILHRKTYGYDRQSKLAPVDLAIGWGSMSDQAVLDQMKISQSMRFYWYEYELPPPIPTDQIIAHSTNLHVIPATPAIASFCKSLRQGDLVHLGGKLVEATGPEIDMWRSSLSRTDTGNGACELMLVEDCWTLNGAQDKTTTLAKH